MDMEIARLASASWLSTIDWQVLTMRAAGLLPAGLPFGPTAAAANAPRRLPPLDWPADLFNDESPRFNDKSPWH